MKKIAVFAAAAILSGCATESGNTEWVTSSAQEQYQTEPSFVFEKDPLKETTTVAVVEPVVTESVVIEQVQEKETVVITAPADEKPVIYKYAKKAVDGYTIQVLAGTHNRGFNQYVKRLPAEQPVWVNEKDLNGSPWYTLLFGQYESKDAARQALKALPQDIKNFGPFIRDLRQIKTSQYPKLTQLNG
ncbi:SPOR domain-containing protein [Photobacterium japonica]|uniref:SPOR domain-containing protein n=1 Tax=Photobacterium japonica TaxID=2910235 RepID=UPI003D0D1AD8